MNLQLGVVQGHQNDDLMHFLLEEKDLLNSPRKKCSSIRSISGLDEESPASPDSEEEEEAESFYEQECFL